MFSDSFTTMGHDMLPTCVISGPVNNRHPLSDVALETFQVDVDLSSAH